MNSVDCITSLTYCLSVAMVLGGLYLVTLYCGISYSFSFINLLYC